MASKRSEFIEELFSKLDSVPVERVIGKRMELTRRGRHYLGLCPFHSDKKLGSFMVTPDKGVWKCYACGEGYGGDAVKFVSLYENKTYLEAAFDISLEEGVISQAEYDRYAHQKYEKTAIDRIRQVREKKKKGREGNHVDQAIIEAVYLAMKEISGISEEHRRHLKEVRKLQERRIRRDYFTFPSVKKKEVVNKILEAVPQAKGHLQDVPGFFYDTQKKEITYSGYKGIGILIRDAYSKVVAVQIRRDKIKEGDNRYVWFSSSFALYDAEGKCTGGNGTGSPKDVTVPQKVKMAYSIAITEGRFKAEKLAENGQFAISLQGVGSWSRIDETISDIKKRCAEKRIGMYKTIYIFYDSDMLGNTAVFDQAIKLGKYVESKFKDMRIMYCVWDMENGKGIDDLILNGKTENIRYICRTDLEEKHEKVLNDLLASVGCSKIVEVEKKCGKKAAVLFAFKLQKNMQELLHS